MGLKKRLKAITKNLEGKLQELLSEITGNPQDRAKGRAKQDEAAIIHTLENIKENARKLQDEVIVRQTLKEIKDNAEKTQD